MKILTHLKTTTVDSFSNFLVMFFVKNVSNVCRVERKIRLLLYVKELID